MASTTSFSRVGPEAVNDVHSRLNGTTVARVVVPSTIEEVAAAVRTTDGPLCVAGHRHAMGGQQFASQATLIDMRSMTAMTEFRAEKDRALATFQAGATWTDVQRALSGTFAQDGSGFSFRQKQTGADRLTLGGTVAVNAHGRGLAFPPFVADVESFRLVDPRGQILTCSRTSRPDLFALACGGYGLFGIVTDVTLRLVPRTRVQRVAELRRAENLVETFEDRRQRGFTYGDFQFRVDAEHPRFLMDGILSCYRPVGPDTPISGPSFDLSDDDWYSLIRDAHFAKSRAYDAYVTHYLRTSGQVYWSDLHQSTAYLDGYHARLDTECGALVPGSEMITELFVPRSQLVSFLREAAVELRAMRASVVYGTIRLVEKDEESVLAWARDRWVCVIFNLHVDHSPAGIAEATAQFRMLIDLAMSRGGSYFLTYHRWARADQVLKCHPRVREFLEAKRKHDPEGRFTSDWHRHLVSLLEGADR